MAAFMQNDRGPLVPGQTISVNKYNVQIERYLSKGGYAYVYLVKTPQPVNGTTHHVLKRIAVPNEALLSEVKKEVDIMRILRGHPNIVQLIDAAWHRLSNGLYEVFILMEFCAGGGIIDMMNRRLRERLTEPEILQIFVDVCEGVAAMHNLRPALLHRDLKVENILQASDTLFKLCDFGSSTPSASRPPATTQEIRALEADLNMHTTLQYRAPEMVDPYLRRPIDEKSDVWALGVLLYKLCYYTTPFEEHGPLAILNVQYKTPSYPVYSSAMNTLIASMLREHGAHRPSVFDLLDVVHRMRGTKSRFTYTRPERQTVARPLDLTPSKGIDPLVAHRPPPSSVVPPAKNAGVQAREKVLEAIAPMRRGRPNAGQQSRPASPEKLSDQFFHADEEAMWKKAKESQAAVRGHRSGLTSPTAWGTKHSMDDAWNTSGRSQDKSDRRKTFQGSAESVFGKGFGDSFDGLLGSSTAAAAAAASASPMPTQKSGSIPINFPVRPSGQATGSTAATGRQRDAFYGLGLSPSEKPAAPTLAETRRLRTGLTTNSSSTDLLSGNLDISSLTPRISPRPSPRISPKPSGSPLPASVSQTSSDFQSQPTSQSRSKYDPSSLSAEERFPSLEDLDHALSPGSSSSRTIPQPHAASQPEFIVTKQAAGTPQLPPRPSQTSSTQSSFTGSSRLLSQPMSSYLAPLKPADDGVRSEHVTGAAMRASRDKEKDTFIPPVAPKPQAVTASTRPPFVRKHRSSISIKHAPPEPLISLDRQQSPASSSSSSDTPSPVPTLSAAEILGRSEPRDWLTGSDDERSPSRPKPAGTPVLRKSPSKRASFIQHDQVFRSPQEAVADEQPKPAEELEWTDSPSPSPAAPVKPAWRAAVAARRNTAEIKADSRPTAVETHAAKPPVKPKPAHAQKPLVSAPPVTEPSRGESLTDNWSPVAPTSSGDEEGPEDVGGARHTFAAKDKRVGIHSGHKARQSSVHDLVDLWGGSTEKKALVSTSASSIKKASAPAHTDQLSTPLSTGTKSSSAVSSAHTFSARTTALVEESRRALSPQSTSLQPPQSFSMAGLPRSSSPAQLNPPAPSDNARGHSPTRTSTPTRSRKISSHANGREPGSSPLPKARTRPQSMILSTIPTKPPAPDTPTPTTPSARSTTVAKPPDPRAGRNTRRTSISDMVLRYEAMGGRPITPGNPVTKVASHGTSTGVLNTRATPMQARSKSQGLGYSEDDADLPSGLPRSSPIGLPGLAAPGVKLTPKSDGQPRSNARLSPAASKMDGPSEINRALESAFLARPNVVQSPRRSPSPLLTVEKVEKAEDEQRSPSPDKPYQGVGRLIDQWQRKTETEPPRGVAGGNSSFGSAGARRTGVVAGAGKGR